MPDDTSKKPQEEMPLEQEGEDARKKEEDLPELDVAKETRGKAEKEIFEGEIVEEEEGKVGTSPQSKPESPEDAGEVEFVEEEQTFSEKFDAFMKELNLSRKHVFYGLGCIVLFAGLLFGGFKGYDWYRNRKPSTKPVTAVEEKKEEVVTGIETAVEIGKQLLTLPAKVGSTGISQTLSLGAMAETQTTLSSSLLLLRRIQNAYETNVDELLRSATDRRSRIRAHVALMKKLQSDGEQTLAGLKQELELIRVQFEEEKTKQETADANFSAEINQFNAGAAQEILDEFIRASKIVTTLRAQHNALLRNQKFYEQALPRLQVRIKDIELNEDALVSGIKVFDVKGSDLQLIISVETGVKVPTSLGDSKNPVFPLLPIHPSQVKVDGRDFISQPVPAKN